MPELKALKCPNCGANTTNAENCEYCGSLLVRFVDKGIDLSTTSYLSDEKTIPGLATELRKNLQLQKTTDDVVVTLIYLGHDISYPELTVFRTGHGMYEQTDTPIVINDKKSGLTIAYRFVEDLDPDSRDEEDEEYEKVFKSMPSYPLFTQHIEEPDKSQRFRHYAIDFGEDAEGAARLISEILNINNVVCERVYEDDRYYRKLEDYNFSTVVGDANYAKALGMIYKDDATVAEEGTGSPTIENDQELDDSDVPSWVLKIVSFLIPIVGIILYFVKKSTQPNSAKAYLIWALAAIAFSFVVNLLGK